MLSDGDVFEWDGTHWTSRPSTHRPPVAGNHCMAFDAARREMVAWGQDGFALAPNSTWTWDGRAWTERSPRVSPPPRGFPALAYDAARERVVMFGGHTSSGPTTTPYEDTWEWDGTEWVQRHSTTSPTGGGSSPAMAYDAARQRCVLVHAGRTWEWDGVDWTEVGGVQPPARSFASMAYDASRRRAVLFGGTALNDLADTWEWDGTTWRESRPAVAPAPRRVGALTYDGVHRRLLLVSGWATGLVHPDSWHWDGTAWREVSRALGPSVKFARGLPRVAFDEVREELLVVGGFNTSPTAPAWLWNGSRWRATPPGPTDVLEASLAYDAAGQRTILYGGGSDEVWSWDGTNWSQLPAGPAARSMPAMAYDAARQRLVLYGGRGGTGTPTETWEWDGTSWLQRFPSTTPPPADDSSRGSMAYDQNAQRAVLHILDELWEWDGSNWTQRPGTAPHTLLGSNLAYDVRRRAVIVVTNGNELWEWGSTRWRISYLPVSFFDPFGLGYDSARQRTLVFGLSVGGGFFGGSRMVVHGSSAEASVTEGGPGCAVSRPPSLHAYGLPWIDTPGFAVDVEAESNVPFVGLFATRWGAMSVGSGCSVWFDPATFLFGTFGMTNSRGFGTLPLPIPRDFALVGQRLTTQAFALQPGGPSPWVVSNALHLVLGE